MLFKTKLSFPEPDAGDQAIKEIGDIAFIGSSETGREGTINPDLGEPVKVYFRGTGSGTYTLRIYTILGEKIHEELLSMMQLSLK